jgi:hypothetical protein
VVLNGGLRKRGILQPEGGEDGGGSAATGGLERGAPRLEPTQASSDVVEPFVVHG